MNWMAWTTPTAVFFLAIAAALLVMSLWEWRSPTVLRRGFLPLATTRGDRFFISLLASAFVHIAWLAVSDGSIWVASGLCLIGGFVLMRWG